MPRKSETSDTRRTSVSSREAHMRVGIISDIHGNLQALEEVLRDIDGGRAHSSSRDADDHG